MNPYLYVWLRIAKWWQFRQWRKQLGNLGVISQDHVREGSRLSVERLLVELGYEGGIIFHDSYLLLVHIESVTDPEVLAPIEQRVKQVIPAGIAVVIYPSIISPKQKGFMWISKVYEEEINAGTYTVRPTASVGGGGGKLEPGDPRVITKSRSTGISEHAIDAAIYSGKNANRHSETITPRGERIRVRRSSSGTGARNNSRRRSRRTH